MYCVTMPDTHRQHSSMQMQCNEDDVRFAANLLHMGYVFQFFPDGYLSAKVISLSQTASVSTVAWRRRPIPTGTM